MSIEAMRELETLASVCPELNTANHTEDDVRRLNDWAIEMSLLVERYILALRPERAPMTPDEISDTCEEAHAHSILSFMKGVRAAESHHDITAQAKKEGA